MTIKHEGTGRLPSTVHNPPSDSARRRAGVRVRNPHGSQVA
jgi:hypothetical protein